ncbi:hypothetical protein SCHPADRAFT_1001449 [Schizopora paradoxa]|uniref:BTB domain-containing protein n=1 Tax=Schizopora paradoxa TaxID=27342 RepID=A0A0H2RDY0_9AGAM|nr:hypothetical protein SCHPADRAFT_1001449 [Schizopora paradoxa]
MNVDAQHEGPSRIPRPHDTLWFFDGNIVLVTDTYLFKVHKSLLALHSSVFKDMFDVVGADRTNAEERVGGDHQEMYEGIPSVKLVGDKGEDVSHLLRTIYERRYFDPNNDKTPIEVITALLTLSTKYDFKDIRKDLVVQLSRLYPTTLKEYDAISEAPDSMAFGEYDDARSAILLKAAFSANIEFLLPVLFLAGSDIATDAIFDLDLTPDCARTLIRGRMLLDIELSKLISDLPEDLFKIQELKGKREIECCLMKKPCLSTARFIHLSKLINTIFVRTNGKLLVEDHLSEVCGGCKSAVEKWIDDKRERIWDDIPASFELSEWSVLRNNLQELVES